MRSARPLFVLATAVLSVAGLVGACGSNVAVTGAGTAGGNTGGQSGTTGTSSTSTGTITTTSSSSSTDTTTSSSSSTDTTTSSSSSTGTTTSSGATTSSGGADGGPTCPGNGDACTGCLSEACASLYCSCYGNLACDKLSQCATACAGDGICLQTCLTTYKDGISAAYLLSNCSDQECVPACPSNGVTLDACQVCLFTQCVPEMNDCLADPECTPLLACWGGCNGGATCIQNCSMTYAAGVGDAQSVVFCSTASCQGTCP